MLRDTQRANHTTLALGSSINSNPNAQGNSKRGSAGLSVSFDFEELRSSRHSVVSLGAGSTVSAVSSSWDEGGIGTALVSTGQMSGVAVEGVLLPGLSGIPCGASSDEDSGEDDDDVFEAADNFDLGAVDLCVSLCMCRKFCKPSASI